MMGSDCASAADRAPSSGWASRSRGSTTGLAPSSDATEKFTVSTVNPRGDGARLPGGVATAGAALNCTRLDGESPTPGGRGGVLTREMTGVVDAFVPSGVPSVRRSSSAPATDRSRATRSTAPTSAFATVLACSVARSVAAAASTSAIAFDAFACASESSRTATRFALAAASALAAAASRAAAASASRSVSSSARNASDSSSIAAISAVKSTVVSAAVDAAGGGVGSMATVSASWTTTESRGR